MLCHNISNKTRINLDARSLADLARRTAYFFFYCYGYHRDLHSFPTRRSSDLELLAKEEHLRLQHVPYRGSAPAALDLVGKRLDFMMDPAAALIEFVRDGRLRALAVTGDRR